MEWVDVIGYLNAAAVGFVLGWLGRGLAIGINKVTHHGQTDGGS